MSVEIKKGASGNLSPKIEKRIRRQEDIMHFVILILVFTVASLLVMVAQVLIDSFRFSSITYTEYSEKLGAIETAQKINNQLLEENKKNQTLIFELHQQILNK